MVRQKRSFRWTLFSISVICFFYTVLVRVSPWVVALFFLSGGGWYWLEQRKTMELDALPPEKRKLESKEPDPY
jgi:hypothetical protein